MPSAVVVGVSGGIGNALICALSQRGVCEPVFAYSRSKPKLPAPVRSYRIDVSNESAVAAAAAFVGDAGPVGLVIVPSAILHREVVSPEKAIRTFDPHAIATVFALNTIGPAVVAKHFVSLLPRSGRCMFAALSARVGSIDDNRRGGWYAYCSSKAALNQILRTLGGFLDHQLGGVLPFGVSVRVLASCSRRPTTSPWPRCRRGCARRRVF